MNEDYLPEISFSTSSSPCSISSSMMLETWDWNFEQKKKFSKKIFMDV